MRSVRVSRLLTVFILLVLLVSESSLCVAAPRDERTHQAYDRAKASYYSIRNRDPRVSKIDSWEAAASDLKEFIDDPRNRPFAPEAAYNLGKLYETMFRARSYKLGLKRSVYYYEYIVKNFSGHPLADDALLALGDLRRDALKDDAGARAAYFEIVDVYSKGDKVNEAKERLGLVKKAKKVEPSTASGAESSEATKEIASQGGASSASSVSEVGEKEEESESASSKGGFSIFSSLFSKDEPGRQVFVEKTPISRPLIVIDPGHGGDDLGAVSQGGIYEKEVVLQISEYLSDMLQERLRARTKLTRTSDTFVALPDRTQLANSENADLFISIHANASPKHNASGIETYYLENTNDASSLKLAERENASLLMSEKGRDLSFIMSDLIQNVKLEDSISLAHHIQNAMTGRLARYYKGINDLGVKKAPFYVLVGAHMPCVLVEVAFIDHPVEGERLVQRRYQKLIAESLYQGVRNYFGRSQAQGSAKK